MTQQQFTYTKIWLLFLLCPFNRWTVFISLKSRNFLLNCLNTHKLRPLRLMAPPSLGEWHAVPVSPVSLSVISRSSPASLPAPYLPCCQLSSLRLWVFLFVKLLLSEIYYNKLHNITITKPKFQTKLTSNVESFSSVGVNIRG